MPPKQNTKLEIKLATIKDIPLILQFIKELAEYEKLLHEVVVTEELLKKSLFGEKPHAEALIGYYGEEPVAFAVIFHTFSTFVGKLGLYLEDLYVKPEMRGKGFGKQLLAYLAKLTKERNCGRLEWAVLDWNEPAIKFYKSLGAEFMNDWTTNRVGGAALDALAKQ